jgi:hypothetical protein
MLAWQRPTPCFRAIICTSRVDPTSWTKPGEGGRPADVLTDEDFDRLKSYLEVAVEYMVREQPDRPAVWGFVTHIIEYSEGGSAQSPPVAKSLDALDRFLTWVDTQQVAG